MGWFDSIGTFISSNKDWLKPVLQTGLGALQQKNTDNSQSQYLEYLRQRENQNYQDSVDQINAYNASLGQGGGGRSNGAGLAAARQTEANRMAASKKANKVSQNTYKKILEMYKPFADTATQLLPQMTHTYEGSLGLQNAMAQYVNSPAQVAKLDASVPAWNINIPLPDSVRIK